MKSVRELVHETFGKDPEAAREAAFLLATRPHSEEKLAGIVCMHEILLPAGGLTAADAGPLKELLTGGHLYDWNACDWFAVKVLASLLEAEGLPFAELLRGWGREENMWCARASLVAFVKAAGEPRYRDVIEESCGILIVREERFAKTAVGWVLREASKHDAAFVVRFVREHSKHFSPESLSNATKHLADEVKGQLRPTLPRRLREKHSSR